jgi:hypothetical protein
MESASACRAGNDSFAAQLGSLVGRVVCIGPQHVLNGAIALNPSCGH